MSVISLYVSAGLAPRNTCCGNACFDSGSKWVQSTELDMVNGSLCSLCSLALGLALLIFATFAIFLTLSVTVFCCKGHPLD